MGPPIGYMQITRGVPQLFLLYIIDTNNTVNLCITKLYEDDIVVYAKIEVNQHAMNGCVKI